MSLSPNTIHNLADALVDDAIQYIQDDREIENFMYNILNDFLLDKMGNMDFSLQESLVDEIMKQLDITRKAL